MQYFPLFMDLRTKPVLVIGGGEVACRKVDTLLRAQAEVTIVSPEIETYLERLVKNGACHWVQDGYSDDYLLKDYVQVWATTDSREINHRVHADATKKGIIVNVVDDQPYCDFITPSIINRGKIQLAISSGGAAPVLIRNLREKIEAILPTNLSLLADFAASKRSHIKHILPSVDMRRRFWEKFFAVQDVKMASNIETLERVYVSLSDGDFEPIYRLIWVEYGEDVELLTLRALRIMQQAEIVLYLPDCPFDYIDLVRRDAERVCYQNDSQLDSFLREFEHTQKYVIVFCNSESAYQLSSTRGGQVMGLGS
jgi:precorrin-2 dehydrogenase/sirohydrochlorin ferrochelatase